MRIYGWHILKDDGSTAYGNTQPELGGLETWDGNLELCNSGLHASRTALDACGYAQGSLVRRVYLYGNIIEGDDKMCASHRRELWRADATDVFHEFACWCAENALTVAKVKDPRSWAAIEAKRKWLRGEITDTELAAARAASWDAASAVSWAAASAASWAAARAAARDAASAAARAAQNRKLTKMFMGLKPRGGTK